MLRFLIKLMKTPQAIFIWSIITKWYIMILIPTIMVTYYVFKGLNDAGVFAMVEQFTLSKFQLAVRIARDCTPDILDLKRLFQCVSYTK